MCNSRIELRGYKIAMSEQRLSKLFLLGPTQTPLFFAAIFKAPYPIQRASQRASIIELFKPTLYYLTPILIAPRVIESGVKPRWLFHPSRSLVLPRS